MEDLLRDEAVAKLEEEAYVVFNQYSGPLAKLFRDWAGRCHLPPDALRTWKDAKINLQLMDMSTFLQLLSTASVIPTLLTSREAIVIYEQSAAVAVTSRTRPDINGHMLDLQHFIGALFRLSLHCFGGEANARYPTGEDKARMLLHVLDHTHKLFKGNFQEITRRQLDLPPSPLTWSAARKEIDASTPLSAVESPRSLAAASTLSSTQLLRRTSATSPRLRSTSPLASTTRSVVSVDTFRPVSGPVDTMFLAKPTSPLPASVAVQPSRPLWPVQTPSVGIPSNDADFPDLFSQIDALAMDDMPQGTVTGSEAPPQQYGRARTSSEATTTARSIPPQVTQTFLPPRMSVRSSQDVADSHSTGVYGSSDGITNRRRLRSKSPPPIPVNTMYKHVTSPLSQRSGGPAEAALVVTSPKEVAVAVQPPLPPEELPVIVTPLTVQAASLIDVASAEEALRVLFARYCRFGERLNIGTQAKLKSSQFAKFCRDAGFVEAPDGAMGHFKSVDADIVFKCLIAQQIMSEQKGKQRQKDNEAAVKVATNGVEDFFGQGAPPGELGPWKQYSFLLRSTPTSMLNRGLSFPEFVQALLLAAVKKFGDIQQYSRVKDAVHDALATSTRAVPLPPPTEAAVDASTRSLEANCLHRVLTDVTSYRYEVLDASDHGNCQGCHSPSRLHRMDTAKPANDAIPPTAGTVCRWDIGPAMALKLLLLLNVLPYASQLGVIDGVGTVLLDKKALGLLQSTLEGEDNETDGRHEHPVSESIAVVASEAASLSTAIPHAELPSPAPVQVTQPALPSPSASSSSSRQSQPLTTTTTAQSSSLQQLADLRRKIELELSALSVGGTLLSTSKRSPEPERLVVQPSTESLPLPSYQFAKSIQEALAPLEQVHEPQDAVSVGTSVLEPETPVYQTRHRSASQTTVQTIVSTKSLPVQAPMLSMLAQHSAASGRRRAQSEQVNIAAPPLLSATAGPRDDDDGGVGISRVMLSGGQGSGVRISASRRRGSSASGSVLNFVPPTAIPESLEESPSVVHDMSIARPQATVPTWPSFSSPQPTAHPGPAVTVNTEEKATPLPALSPSMWLAAVANHNQLMKGAVDKSPSSPSSPVAREVSSVMLSPPPYPRGTALGYSYVSSYDIDPTPQQPSRPVSGSGMFPDVSPTLSRGSASPSPRQPKPTHDAVAENGATGNSGLTRSRSRSRSPVRSAGVGSALKQSAPATPPRQPQSARSRSSDAQRRKSVTSSPSRGPPQSPSLASTGPRSPGRASFYSSWTGATRLSAKSKGDSFTAELHNTIAGTRPTGPVAVPFSSLPRFVEDKRAPGLWAHQTQLLKRFEYVDSAPKSYGSLPPTSPGTTYHPRKYTEITQPVLRPPSSTGDALIHRTTK